MRRQCEVCRMYCRERFCSPACRIISVERMRTHVERTGSRQSRKWARSVERRERL